MIDTEADKDGDDEDENDDDKKPEENVVQRMNRWTMTNDTMTKILILILTIADDTTDKRSGREEIL